GLQIKAHHDAAASGIVDAHAAATALVAERADSNMALALGASSAAAHSLSNAITDANTLANAASRAGPTSAAAILNGREIQALTDPAQASLVASAVRQAGGARVWVGAPDMGRLATAPVIVRRVGDMTIVSVLDARQLLPQLDPRARVLIASDTGTLLFASPGLISAGARAQQQLATATSGGAGAIVTDGAGQSWAAAQ